MTAHMLRLVVLAAVAAVALGAAGAAGTQATGTAGTGTAGPVLLQSGAGASPTPVDATGVVSRVDPQAGTITLQDGRVLHVTPRTTLWQPVPMTSLHAALLADRARPRLDVARILHPRSVAVFGASDSTDKFGGRIMSFLVRHGFAGDIYPISLRHAAVLGRRAYPAIAAVPTPPDVAILAVPPASLVQSVREAAEAGVGGCVIISTGFAEAGADGAARQAELVEITQRTGLRIVGPNCMGLIVPHHRLALCSSVVLDTERLHDGPIGLVSQSGALMVSIFDRAGADGLGFRHCVSLGNQADLEISDFVEYMVEEPGTEAICVYVEGLLDGPRFRAALAAARRARSARARPTAPPSLPTFGASRRSRGSPLSVPLA